MSDELAAVTRLNERFLTDYPREAARALEAQSPQATVQVLLTQSPEAQLRCWAALSPDRAADVLDGLPAPTAQHLLVACEPQVGAAALSHLPQAKRETLLAGVTEKVSAELRELMQYPRDVAGSLMDPRVAPIGAALSVAEAIDRLRSIRAHGMRELFVVDAQMHLVGQIDVGDLLLAGRERPLREITHPVTLVVRDSDPVAKVADALRQQPLDVLPVVNEHGRFKGAIRVAELMSVLRQQGRGWHPEWTVRGSN